MSVFGARAYTWAMVSVLYICETDLKCDKIPLGLCIVPPF